MSNAKKILAFVIWILLCPSAWSFEASHQFQTVQKMLDKVRQKAFPELQSKRISLSRFQASDAYFQSNFNLPTLFTTQPEYVIEVNPLLWQRGCPPFAIEGILAHELSHTLDYVEGGKAGIIGIGLQLLSFEGTRRYEHRSDLRALFRGYGNGLIAYRRWIYAQLTPDQLKRKQAIYYQPHEILLLQRRLERSSIAERRALEQAWLKEPPMTLQEMNAVL